MDELNNGCGEGEKLCKCRILFEGFVQKVHLSQLMLLLHYHHCCLCAAVFTLCARGPKLAFTKFEACLCSVPLKSEATVNS